MAPTTDTEVPSLAARIAHVTVYFVVRSLLCIIQSLSLQQCEALSRSLAWVCGDLLQFRRDVLDDNLRHAFPDWSASKRRQTARGMWRHLFMLLCEMALAQRKIHETNWRDYVRVEGERELLSRMLSPRPIVVVTAHFGNFEMSGYMAGLFGCPTYTIVRPLDNPYLDRFLCRFREGTGQRLFPSHGTAELAQAVLKSNGTLALLGDHHGGPKGCWVEFFGRPASCHKSVALFPLANRLPLLVLLTTRRGRLLQLTMKCAAVWDPQQVEDRDRATVPELTQWYNGELEREIRQAPAQYWWLHKRWKERPARVKQERSAVHVPAMRDSR